LVWTLNRDSTYQEIPGSDDSKINQIDGSPNRKVSWNKRSFQGGKGRVSNGPAFLFVQSTDNCY